MKMPSYKVSVVLTIQEQEPRFRAPAQTQHHRNGVRLPSRSLSHRFHPYRGDERRSRALRNVAMGRVYRRNRYPSYRHGSYGTLHDNANIVASRNAKYTTKSICSCTRSICSCTGSNCSGTGSNCSCNFNTPTCFCLPLNDRSQTHGARTLSQHPLTTHNLTAHTIGQAASEQELEAYKNEVIQRWVDQGSKEGADVFGSELRR